MNRLLAALMTTEPDVLMTTPRVERELGAVFHEAGERLRYAYLPIDAVVAPSAGQDGDGPIATGTVGCEGVASALAVLGDHIGFERAVVQVPGSIAQLPIASVDALLARAGAFPWLIGRYLQACGAQLAQSVVCNAAQPS